MNKAFPNAYANRDEYAISTWTMDIFPLEETLRTIAENGFTTVELWGDTVHFDPRCRVRRSDIRRWLDTYSLGVHSVHAPFRNFMSPPTDEPSFRALRMDLWRRTLEDCAEFRVPIMVVHAMDRFEYNYTDAQAGIVGECLDGLVTRGKELGVMIALENISPSPTPTSEILCTLENQSKLFAGIDLRFCLDIGHAPLNCSDPFREADIAGDRLVTMHIHNNDGVNDSHTLPNDPHGVLDWPKLRAHIREKGYTGQFVMEVHGGTDPKETVRQISRLFD